MRQVKTVYVVTYRDALKDYKKLKESDRER